ncbi:MAG: 2-hydroxymuconate tautomerase family protein [Actinobacteria bacterium]|nr:2-hydroxymuconate tautomerase family protein [Actinomycetota bacterium]
MPIISVTMIEGRSSEEKQAFMGALTAAATTTLGSPPESVRVILNEVSSDNFSVAGETMTARRAKNNS